MLAYFSRNRGRPARPVIDHIWGDVAVAENSSSIRTSAVLAGTASSEIRTVPKRGYLFEGFLAEAAASSSKASLRVVLSRVAGPAFDRRVAVRESERGNSGHFADGVTEDLITGLSRIKRLFVIARNSTFFRDRATDVSAIGLELGVRYVLRGGVRRRAAKRLRQRAAD